MRILRRVAFWWNRSRHDADLTAELEDHRARTQAALEKDGLPPGEAALRSRRAMGNISLAREDARDVWVVAIVDRLWRDIVYGARALRRERTFAVAAILTLTLGSATAITVFSVVNAELWRPLPYPSPHELIAVDSGRMVSNRSIYDGVSGPDFEDFQAQSRLTAYAAQGPGSRRVLRRENAEFVWVAPVSANFFDVLRLPPAAGRLFQSADARGGRVAVLSETGWTRLFGKAIDVVGRTVSLDGEAYDVVGIASGQRLEFTSDPDFFVPIVTTSREFHDRALRTLSVYGRVQGGIQAGQAELDAVAARLAAAWPDLHARRTFRLVDLQEWSTGFNWRSLFFFLGAATLVLLLSSLNVANLLLSRALRRQREFAIRGALGGGRAALLRQLIVEGALVALPAAVAGAIVSVWILDALSTRFPPNLLSRGTHVSMDHRVGGFVFAITCLTTVLLALAPIVFARRVDLNVMLTQGGRAVGRSLRQGRLRTALLVGQVTLTLVLLTGAMLFLLSFARLSHAPLGFDPDNRFAARLTLAGAAYADDAQVRAFARALLEQARAVPGLRDAVVGSVSPLDPRGGQSVQIAVSGASGAPRGDEPIALIRAIGAGYFNVLGIRQLAGRDVSSEDVEAAPRVAIVNELLARRMFPGRSALGQRLEIIPHQPSGWTHRPGTVTIVGIVNNIRNLGIAEVEFNALYLPFAQAPSPDLELIGHTAVPIERLDAQLRAVVARIDPRLPIRELVTLPTRVDEALSGDRFNLILVTFFAVAAVLVAGVGIFGSVACATEERTREFGVRMALGAPQRAVMRIALWDAARVGLAGGVIGLAVAIIASRVMGDALYLVPGQHGGLLYGVTTTNPMALGAALATVVLVSIASGLPPARHATRIDPVIALRSE